MIPAALAFIVWSAIALLVGIAIGKVITSADRRDAARREAQRCPVCAPRTWVA